MMGFRRRVKEMLYITFRWVINSIRQCFFPFSFHLITSCTTMRCKRAFVPRVNHEFSKRNIRYIATVTYNSTSDSVIAKIYSLLLLASQPMSRIKQLNTIITGAPLIISILADNVNYIFQLVPELITYRLPFNDFFNDFFIYFSIVVHISGCDAGACMCYASFECVGMCKYDDVSVL